MRRVILTMLLAVVSSSVMAEWVKVNENSEFATYANRSSIRKKGHIVKMWSMYDYKKVQTRLSDSVLYKSTKQQGVYDCKDEKSRIRSSSLYLKKMGGGRVIHNTSGPLEWQIVTAKGIDETLWKIACGKKASHQD